MRQQASRVESDVRFWLLQLVFLFMVAGCGQANATAPLIAGLYIRKAPSLGEMQIQPAGSHWKISISAGGLPRGPATAADCSVVADGNLKGTKLIARIRDDDPAVERLIKMRVSSGRAVITFGQVEGICGMGSDVSGVYVKKR